MSRKKAVSVCITLSALVSSCSLNVSPMTSSPLAGMDEGVNTFQTQALSQTYLLRKIQHWLNTANGARLVREIDFARQSHPALLAQVVAENPALYPLLINHTAVQSASAESPVFADYLESIDPNLSASRACTPSNCVITTVAGNGLNAASPDGGLAVNASLFNPRGVAVDSSGNVYIADRFSHRIRKVDQDGVITTVAGNGTEGFSGDGAQAPQAMLNYPLDIAMAANGNLYIADSVNYRVRQVSSLGVITTVAGNGTQGFSGDNGSAQQAQLYRAWGVGAAANGIIYIADTFNHRIRKVDQNGVITTVAGNGIPGFSGDNGPAQQAQLDHPYDVAVDSTGNLYITDYFNHRIRKVDTNGQISTFAGNGNEGFGGDGAPALNATLYGPHFLVLDAEDNLYFTDTLNHRVRKIDTSGIISTLAGTGTSGFSGDNGPAASAQLNQPNGIAVDALGQIYIVDLNNRRVRRLAAQD